MKKLSFIASMLLIASTASAQFANTSGSATASDNENYSRVEVSYNPITVEKGPADIDLTGITAGYIKAFNVTSMPLFVEVGGRLSYGFSDKNGAKSQLIQVSVPVNAVYKYTLPSNSDISIAPFVGLVFKGNIAGETKYDNGGSGDWDEDFDWEDWEDYYSTREYDSDYDSYLSTSDKTDWFDKDGMDGNRFQMGWNIGVGVNYNKAYLGFSYGAEFMELAKKTDTKNFAITIGYTF